MKLQDGQRYFGFDPSDEEIKPFVEQNYHGLTALAAYINDNENNSAKNYAAHFSAAERAWGLLRRFALFIVDALKAI